MAWKVGGDLERYLTGFAGVIAGVVAAAITGAYLLTAFEYEADRIAIETRLAAAQISKLAYASPKSWTYQEERLEEVLTTFGADQDFFAGPQHHVLIFDEKGDVVQEWGTPILANFRSRESPLSDGFRTVGHIRITENVRHIWVRAGVPVLLGIALAVMIFLVLKILPLRALMHREKALEKAKDLARASEQQTIRAHTRLTDAIEVMSDGFMLFGTDDRAVVFNDRFAELYDGSPHLLMPGSRFEDLARSEATSGAILDAAAGVDAWLAARMARHRDPSGPFDEERAGDRWLRVNEHRTDDGGTLCIRTDISESKRIEKSLRLAATVFENTTEALMVTDIDNNITSVNPAFTRITGYTLSEVLGRNPSVLKSGKQPSSFYETLWQSLQSAGTWTGEMWNRRKNGEIYPQWASINVLRDEDGQAVGYAAIFRDISQRKEYEDRINYQANYDSLTGLPNRNLFHERLRQAMLLSQRRGEHEAVLFLDLDNFKMINDSLGHNAGDIVIQKTAERLIDAVRETDTVARMGGDEFTILLVRIANAEGAAIIARKLLSIVAEPMELLGHRVTITASIGIAISPHDTRSADDLIKFADGAMYHAKSQGKNNFQYFTSEMKGVAIQRLTLETGLRAALENDEFELHYQPRADLASGEIAGIEALVRWRHPKEGLIPPADFIPTAEETGLILPLGQWVLRAACTQNRVWQDTGIPPVSVSVNISARQFRQPGFADIVGEVLAETGLPPEYLELEVTESMVMGQAESAIDTLRQLNAMGVRLSIDDFGTGYSSLSYLKRFPIDALKIDQSFVRDINTSADDLAIVNTIIVMAHQLNIQAVAEGVETDAQLALLRAQGVDQIQGFILSPPVPADELVRLLKRRRVNIPAA